MYQYIFCFLMAMSLAHASASESNNNHTLTPSINIPLTYFGYSGIACDLDDPFDNSHKTEYSDEVAHFTNLNQVCVTADRELLEERLRHTSALYHVAFYIEPVFFEYHFFGGRLNSHWKTLWSMVVQAIHNSDINPENIIFYLTDEPTLKNLDLSNVDAAAQVIKSTFPSSKIMMIEAYRQPVVPVIPNSIDMWGFNAYTLFDPAQNQGYIDYLNAASAQLKAHQSLVLVMDGQHTPIHTRAGLRETDMANVAYNYFALATSRQDISAMLAYTWAGGIDNNQEKGVRDLPPVVANMHQLIGYMITGKQP